MIDAWQDDYFTLSEMCNDDFALLARLIRLRGCKLKPSKIIFDMDLGRMQKYHKYIEPYLEMEYGHLMALIDNEREQMRAKLKHARFTPSLFAEVGY